MQQVYRPKKHTAEKSSRAPFYFITIFFIAAAGFGYVHMSDAAKEAKQNNFQPARFEETPKQGKLKIYTPQEFRDLYNSFAYPNTEAITEKTPITGNVAADAHIRTLAERRGYVARSAPVADTFRDVGDNSVLQERAAQPWLDMKTAAKNDGELLFLTAGFRPAAEQRTIFLERLQSSRFNVARIPTGAYDQQIDQILSMTAVPGYSRHHTGYTIDIGCENDPDVLFEQSSCFQWLSKNNYENAKKFGWIPSYPEGTGKQGPEPESWEYVWVGVDTLTE